MAAPFLDEYEQPLGAITVMAPLIRLRADRFDDVGRRCLLAARDIEQKTASINAPSSSIVPQSAQLIMIRPSRHAIVCRLALSLVVFGSAEADERLDFFEKKIRPILAQECYECHSVATKQANDLALDTRVGWQTVVLAGRRSSRAILKKVSSFGLFDMKNPACICRRPEPSSATKSLPISKTWIAWEPSILATFLRRRKEVEKAHDWSAIAERRLRWWSFQPIVDPMIPSDEAWSSHPIDRFLRKRTNQTQPNVSPRLVVGERGRGRGGSCKSSFSGFRCRSLNGFASPSFRTHRPAGRHD